MKKLFLTLSILFSIHTLDSLVAQSELLKPIEIKKNKFYQEGIRLKPGKPLELALMKANNTEVNDLFKKGKNTQTLGVIIESLGLLVMGVGLLSGGESAGSYTLGRCGYFTYRSGYFITRFLKEKESCGEIQ